MSEDETLKLVAKLEGHNGWVTQIATNPKFPDVFLSSSRDKTLIMWKLTPENQNEYGYMQKRLKGHNHFVSDVVLSSDGLYALSGSWDKTLRLWDLSQAKSTRRFESHTKDVLSVAFSPDNRQIVSGSRDKTIKLWNTLGRCKYTLEDGGHTDWVSCVKFSPNDQSPIIVSSGWDRTVKVWSLQSCKLKTNHVGHKGYINTVAIAPDGSLAASGGQDGATMLWDLSEDRYLNALEQNDTVNAMCFSPNRFWLCTATGPGINIWDLENKKKVEELRPETDDKKKKLPECISLAWSVDGQTLFAGYTDNIIRVWKVFNILQK